MDRTIEVQEQAFRAKVHKQVLDLWGASRDGGCARLSERRGRKRRWQRRQSLPRDVGCALLGEIRCWGDLLKPAVKMIC